MRSFPARCAFAMLLGGSACAEGEPGSGAAVLCETDEVQPGASDPFVDCVVGFEPHEEASFGADAMPGNLMGPPRGTSDVLTLGCEGEITVRFDGPGIRDGDGPDLVVFENPFDPSFPEAGEVSVSVDGLEWFTWACDPLSLAGCAGLEPVMLDVDPQDPAAGGDRFDLADLPVGDLDAESFHYVRIRDRSRAYWESLGESYCDPGQGGAGGFDLDAVMALGSERSEG